MNILLFRVNGREISLNLDQKMFAAKLNMSGQDREFDSCDFELTKIKELDGDRRCVSWRGDFNGEYLDVEILFSSTETELISQARVKHSGKATLESFSYPYVQKDDVATYDNLLFSSAWGDKLPRPTKTIRDVSTSTSIRFEQDYIRYAPDEVIYTYPSIMAMQYIVLYNENKSLYLATYSLADETMTFHAKTLGRYSLGLWTDHYPFLHNDCWTSPECSVSLLDGGWHSSAKLYAKHMNPAFFNPDSPAWMRESYHGWIEAVVKYSWSEPQLRFEDLGSFYKKIHEQTGMNHIFLVGWHDNGHDTKFPSYQPCEAAGGADALKAAIREIHALGGKVSLYTNARLIDTNGEFYLNGGNKAVSLDRDGNEYLESYDSGDVFAVSCPGCDEYVTHMASVGERIAEEYGADGMFEDQISCNLDHFCYSTEHEHKIPSANFLPGVDKELKALRIAQKKCNPDFHSFSEGCHERFNQFYDVNQGHGEEFTWQIGESMPEQFLYTYPDRFVTGHCADKHQLYHSMAQFKPLDIKGSCYTDETTHLLIRAYVALRNEYGEFFLRGRFIDDDGFNCIGNYKIFAMESKQGAVCASIWAKGADESGKQRAIIEIPEGYKVEKALFADDAQIKAKDRIIEITWTGELCYVVFCLC